MWINKLIYLVFSFETYLGVFKDRLRSHAELLWY